MLLIKHKRVSRQLVHVKRIKDTNMHPLLEDDLQILRRKSNKGGPMTSDEKQAELIR